MRRAPVVVAVVSLLSLAPFVTWSFLAAGPTGTPSTAPQDERPRKKADGFHHGPHLPADWRTHDAQRLITTTCGECHVFDAPGATGYEAIHDACAKCHRTDVDPSFLTYRRPATRAGGPEVFDHSHPEHRKKSCLECHEPYDGATFSSFRNVNFTVRRDLSTCVECHGVHDPKTPSNRLTGDGKRCDECHRDRVPQPVAKTPDRVFSHTHHLAGSWDSGAWSAEACGECHAFSIRTETGGEGLEIDFDDVKKRACDTCHNGAEPGESLVVANTVDERRRHSTFHHERHKKLIDEKGCAECHRSGPGPGDPVRPQLRGESVVSLYRTCVDCHHHSEQTVQAHGAWGQCMECHTDESSGRMKTVTVTRSNPGAFRFGFHAHPEVTGHGPEIEGKDCTECHRSGRDKLVRDQARTFSHATHVAATPDSRACTICHAGVTRSAGPDQLARWEDDGHGRGKRCIECHLGGNLETAARDERREVPLFRHHTHSSYLCVKCHQQQPSGEMSLPGTDSCAECHGHRDETTIAVTGSKERLTAEELSRCKDCHVPRAPGDNRTVSPEYDRTRVRTSLRAGRQHHDKGGACARCHGYDAPPTGRVVAEIGDIRHSSLHNHPGLGRSRSAAGECANCHRANIRQTHRRSLIARRKR